MKSTILWVALLGAGGALAASPCQLITPGESQGNLFAGPTSCSKGKAESLKIEGPLKMDNTSVTKDLVVNGPATITGAKVGGKLRVNGPVSLDHSQVTGDVKINGPLFARGSTVKGDLDVSTNVLTLSKTTVNNIVVRDQHPLDGQMPRVVLSQGTKVNGSITFDGKAGEVYVQSGASVKGKLVNGSLK